jgi:dTDP-4-dehydrorhamnose 3,5-epimerase
MEIRQLAFDGVYLIRPDIYPDNRGQFLELFSQGEFQRAVGHPLTVAQVNCSLSLRGTIRGLHAVALPPGQSRYIACVSGAVIDIVVDIRVGSPTFGQHIPVTLDASAREMLYLAEGHGHGFAPLTDEATVVYMCSSAYAPEQLVLVNPLDQELALPWPESEPVMMSEKDRQSPTLREAAARGTLPVYSECQARYAELCAAGSRAGGSHAARVPGAELDEVAR